MIKKYIFLAILFSLSFIGNSQNNYTVSSIPFQQYTASSVVQGTMDDKYSDVIALPFSFDFYGTTYNQIVVSTNGYIDFRTNLANMGSPFAFSQTIPNVAFPVKNSILGAYADLNNVNAQGTITYGVYGTAPHRKFVVYFWNNSFFACPTMKSTFQMVLHESSNIIDVQLVDKQTCSNLNSGKTVSGLINSAGDMGIAAPGRNTSTWTAFHEGWRYTRPGYYTNYQFVRCDDNTDGFQTFNLNVAATDLSPANPSGITFYASLTDAQANVNAISNSATYSNISNPQTLYASGNGMIKQVTISVIDCAVDVDTDTVGTALEDINNDTNLANDDTDGDGLANYIDNDDDGDLVLTNVEYVFAKTNQNSVNSILDTDNDSIPNYLDNDDDGDGVLTFREDYDGDGNPGNDDTNANGTPDYLEQGVALGVHINEMEDQIVIYPNPVNDIVYIENSSDKEITAISIYAINGSLVKEIKASGTIQSVVVSDLQSGIYFVKVVVNDDVLNYKFIKR
jgi:Secretion system C-terminal sorting domain